MTNDTSGSPSLNICVTDKTTVTSNPSISGTVTNQVVAPLTKTEHKIEQYPSREYINKPTMLIDILNDIYQKNYTTSYYTDEKKHKIEVNTIPSKDGGGVAMLRFERGKQNEVKKALLACINLIYPLYDRNVAEPITSPKQLAELAGLKKRKDAITAKELDSYYPRQIDRLNRFLDGGDKITLALERFKFRVDRRVVKRGKEKIESGYASMTGSSSLCTKIEKPSGEVIYSPNYFITVLAYGQTPEKARELAKDPTIERLRHQKFTMGRLPTPEQRKKLKQSSLMVQQAIERGAYHLKLGRKTTARCWTVAYFRNFYKEGKMGKFIKNFVKTLNNIKEIEGGDWWFTNQKNTQGKRSKKRVGDFIIWDYQTFAPYLRRKNLSMGRSDASKYQK